MTKLPAGLSYESTLEHIIEHVVLNVIAPDNASADELDASIREFTKVALRLNELEPASDSLIDEIAAEMIEWHAPRPDEEGWNPDLADAPAAQRLMDWNRCRADIAAEERRQAWAHVTQEREQEREQATRQDKFQRVRQDAARRRDRGDHEGADFIEKWIAQQERAP
jgi:hypothetical protein